MRVFLVGAPSFLDESAFELRDKVKVVGMCHDAGEAMRLIADLDPDVAVVDLDMGGLEAGSQIARQNPRVMVFLAADRPGIDLWRRAVSRGMRGTVRKPLDAREVIQAADSAREEESRRARASKALDEPRPADAGFVAVVAKQEIIVFFSPKGGVGKTTLAVNLAAAYLAGAKAALRPIVLDFDENATVASLLQLNTSVSVSDWADLRGESVDRRTMDGMVVRHSSGLAVVPGVRGLEDSDALTAELTQRVIESARRHFDIVVIDAGTDLKKDSALVSLDLATRIFVVGALDVPTLREVNKAAENFRKLHVDESKARLILNRIPRKPDISVREVAELMSLPLVARIPEDPAVQVYGNRGEAIVLSRPDSPFSVEVRKLAGGVMPAAAVSRPQPGLFERLFRRKAVS